jgi:hypothetical protein
MLLFSSKHQCPMLQSPLIAPLEHLSILLSNVKGIEDVDVTYNSK